MKFEHRRFTVNQMETKCYPSCPACLQEQVAEKDTEIERLKNLYGPLIEKKTINNKEVPAGFYSLLDCRIGDYLATDGVILVSVESPEIITDNILKIINEVINEC